MRLSVVVLVALAGAIAALVDFSLPGRQGCELTGQQSPSYQARFVEPVSVTQTSHEIMVTRDGSPVARTGLCINTEMIGMSGMGYSNKARQVGPGRFKVNFQFGMAGTYTGNVVVDEHGNQISIPVKTKVTQPGP
ncbi:MAG TPA: FixH family protein [Solirubrobacteraceae bacterium]|nr:FixH family protein [Solirubrobacteraceae bacterium]